MRIGVIADWREGAVFITPPARKLLKLNLGDYVFVNSEVRDTQVCRRLLDIRSLACAGNAYAYVDPYTFHLLDSELDAPVLLSASPYTFDMP